MDSRPKHDRNKWTALEIAIFALEPTQGMSALNELAAYNKQAIPRLVEIANSFKTDIEVRLAAKHPPITAFCYGLVKPALPHSLELIPTRHLCWLIQK